ncbi:sugar ABC transporter substrate-binding protein [Lederbergia sp. NSJ-179]|uniref:ABC transporter substrate-binding protein n=1 Tax=Lederbergia sp. NSJ-179 TaxID=2931402 RepID=UPI001FD1D266|nr:sugar ABC transporter substrate-binding protein [Lederbergia sp. NSJ-179]MCJ7841284.1 sugar ABC transporter substrate-binding protein [Lederbergia sp. NSJ-179]
MKKLQFLKWGSLMIATILILAGCSSGGKSTNSSSKKEVHLTMAAWGNPAEIKVYQRALDEYEKQNPNVKVKLIPVPGDNYEQKLLTQLSGGQGNDVFYVGSETISKLISTGTIADLTDFLNSSESLVKPDEFAEGLWGPAKLDGKIYGVSVDANPYLMYYNKKLLKEAGIEKTPQDYYEAGEWNWDAFEAITGKLRDAGKKGFVVDNNNEVFFSWVWSNGGQLYDNDGNYILEENEKAQEVFKYLERLLKNGNATYAGSLPKGQGADAMFMSNQVGFVNAGRWLTPMFSENKSLDFDYIPWPTNTGNKMEPTSIGVAFMAVNKESKNLEEAMKFMSFYTSVQGQNARLKDNGNAIPSVAGIDDLVTEAEIPDHPDYLIDAREIGIIEDKQTRIPGLGKEVTDIMDLMYLGKQDSDKTIKEVSKKVKEVIANQK